MRNSERRAEYLEYIHRMAAGKIDQKTLDHLNNAFNVTVDDINKEIDTCYSNIKGMSNAERSAVLTVLMDDLRDYRDSTEIKANRSDILKQAMDITHIDTNIRYIFPE